MFGYDFSTQTWDLPLVRLGIFLFNFAADEVRPVLQRLMEVALSALALLVLSPVLICVAIAIKTESKGPVFFKQNRTGKDGQVFQILKLRTMYSGDAKGVEQATQHDARVTKIGRILRKTSFDEIPQFINVLRGDMALVGPRPHAVEHDAYYSGVIPTYTKRFAVRPGLTGWAQINNQRGETDTIEKMAARVRFDLEYIKRPSFVFDLMIIFMTPLVLFSTKNAY